MKRIGSILRVLIVTAFVLCAPAGLLFVYLSYQQSLVSIQDGAGSYLRGMNGPVGTTDLTNSGKLQPISIGTNARIIARSDRLRCQAARVKLLDGPHAGEQFWVCSNYIEMKVAVSP